MKIGILTFHCQMNYGGVLQCFALQNALEKLGHEVVIIDRWLPSSICIWNFYKWGDKKHILRLLFGMWLVGDLGEYIRYVRTKRFIKTRLHLTTYHFREWEDAPSDLGIDLIVVGSDQVWHCGHWCNPKPYLLDGAPSVPAISYAASFGMPKLSDREKKIYNILLRRFYAISCREKEGAEICHRLGLMASHVLDPTLLSAELSAKRIKKRKVLVCYFLSEDIDSNWHCIDGFAKRTGYLVKVFVKPGIVAVPRNIKQLNAFFRMVLRHFSRRVKIKYSAGPEEFVKAFEEADAAISDSFHALMYSIINNVNIRMIRPINEMRQEMFSRIEEFEQRAKGRLVVNNVQEAIDSLVNEDRVVFDRLWLNKRQAESREWLSANINKLH